MKIILSFLRHHWLPSILIVSLGVWVVFLLSKDTGNETEVRKSFFKSDISNAVKITCTYPQVLSTSYLNEKISHTLNKPETNPLIFTFSKFVGEKGGQLSYIDSTRTITNVPLVKLLDNEEKIIFIDGDASNYLSIHTLYKKEGVSSYTKNVSIFGVPMSSLAMGSCVGY